MRQEDLTPLEGPSSAQQAGAILDRGSAREVVTAARVAVAKGVLQVLHHSDQVETRIVRVSRKLVRWDQLVDTANGGAVDDADRSRPQQRRRLAEKVAVRRVSHPQPRLIKVAIAGDIWSDRGVSILGICQYHIDENFKIHELVRRRLLPIA